MGAVRCSVQEFRKARGLSQGELASRAGISRQALCAIEAGRAVPGTDVALKLARTLGCRLELLFSLGEPPAPVEAALAGGGAALGAGSSRVTLAEIDGRWIAHPLDARHRDALSLAADGLARPPRSGRGERRVRVEPLGDLDRARQRLVVMGCAPALGLLAARLGEEPAGPRVSWVPGGSTAALEALQRGEVHAAGIHLLDEESGQYNAPFVERLFPGRQMLLVNLVSWEQGIVVAAGNPLRIRRAADLLRPGLRFVSREPGAGAHRLLERALEPLGARPEGGPRGGAVARGHMEVAEAVALGAGDAGIAIRSAALAYGLGFVPLAEERFDLVIPRELGTDARIERLIDALGSRAFRRELASVGGYGTGQAGHVLGASPRR